MLKGQNIICISSIDWDFVWQGHQEVMSTFARNDNTVLFIENTGIRMPTVKDIPRIRKRLVNWLKSVKGFRKEMQNLYIYSPLILPFPYSRIARYINRKIFLSAIRKWMNVVDFHNPIIWTFLPTGFALDVIDNIDKKSVIYYCIADFYELADNPKKVARAENELIKKSDLIFAQGNVLSKRLKALNDNVYIFPFGVNIETFENFKDINNTAPTDIVSIRKPIIGYIGGVHKHIDFRLLKFLAHSHPEWSIVLIGPIQTSTNEIDGINNIFLLGKKDFYNLPSYINEFDVCIIPYNRTEYTETVYPTKLNEYHAMGKPVVSTDLPEVVKFNTENNNLIFVGKSHKEFSDCITQALNDSDDLIIKNRIESARRNSWIGRIEQMSGLIEDAIEIRHRQPVNWQENLLRIYRISQRRLFKIGTICLVVYLLLFYTPLIWFIADPLKISGALKRSDCIVVFSGGVGESGKAGQGYEERVKYAVELYKKGYANQIIFSSGYIYIFEEPLVMKALAISLGVPEGAIILENKAKNTYENVKFTTGILNNKGWNKILLVSSIYHMRRVSLVFNKIAKDTEVVYAPITNSLFYSHPRRDGYGRLILRQVNLQQIRGIFHEYIGIIYYWLRGYI